METSEAFFHLRVDPAVMELPAVFFLKWILSIEVNLNVSWTHVMPLAALFSWELRIMKRGCWKSSLLSGSELPALKGS